MDGYVDYVSAEDIDGINDVYGTLNAAVLGKPEEIFATTRYCMHHSMSHMQRDSHFRTNSFFTSIFLRT